MFHDLLLLFIHEGRAEGGGTLTSVAFSWRQTATEIEEIILLS